MDIIDNYNRLTLGQYQEIQEISRNESLEDIDKQVQIISILTGMAESRNTRSWWSSPDSSIRRISTTIPLQRNTSLASLNSFPPGIFGNLRPHNT